MLYFKEKARSAELISLLTIVAVALPVFFVVSPLLSASEATSDVAGSRDFDLIQRFPRSHIIQYERNTADLPYTVILGSLKKINNVLSPKRFQQVEGKLTSITYRIPDGRRSDEVSDHFLRKVAENKGEILFQCQGRDCGSSNYWANTIFKRSVLYGPEQFQNFFVARFQAANTIRIASIYAAQRGNKRLYAHLDIIEFQQSDGATDPQTLLNRLLARGVYLLSDVAFDPTHHLTPESSAAIAVAAQALKLDESVRVYVVGHLEGSDGLQSLVDHSRQRADQVESMLIEQGVKPSRISAHGVGPLAPLGNSSGACIELVLAR